MPSTNVFTHVPLSLFDPIFTVPSFPRVTIPACFFSPLPAAATLIIGIDVTTVAIANIVAVILFNLPNIYFPPDKIKNAKNKTHI